MKYILVIGLLFVLQYAHAQAGDQKLLATMKEFHQALVSKNVQLINKQADDHLTYGHSNGWVQTKTDLVNDFENGLISYQSIKEDSIKTFVSDNIAQVRFTADINVTLRGNTSDLHLRVLEVWVQKNKEWKLLSRQAVR